MLNKTEAEGNIIFNYLIRFQINIYAVLLLIILYSIIRMQRDIYRFSSFLLDIIIWLTIIALVIEPLSFIFDGTQFPLGIAINYISNYGLVIISPVLIGMWASYLDYKILGDRNRLLKRMYYQQGSLIMLVLCIINVFKPFIFSIAANHHYQSGPFQWIGYVFVYSYYIEIVAIAFLNRKRIRNSMLYGIIAFFVLPIFGTMMQMFNSNLFLAWTMMAMATIVVYILLETTTGIRDFLTKLYSRRALENYITNLMETKRPYGVVMIDLNSFKLVNDLYGHQIGDMMLIRFSEFLLASFEDEKMIARLGGDEFFLVFEKQSAATVMKRMSELQDQVINDPTFKKYNLPGFSWGMTRSEDSNTIDSLFLAADREMYINKQTTLSNQKQ